MTTKIKKIQRTARWVLFTSLGLGVATAAFFFVSHWRFYPNDYSYQWMTVSSALFTVLITAAILLMVRRNIPQIRQLDSIDERLDRYAIQVSNIYHYSLVVVLLDCILLLLSHNSVLFMLLMLLVVTLIMVYPSSIRMKVDLGLTDEEFEQLFPTEQ